MNASTWVKSNVEYGRQLVGSGLAGAECGGKEFLHNHALWPFLSEAARNAVKFGTAAACVGVGVALLIKSNRRRTCNTLVFAIAGTALGFAAGVTWESRKFLAGIARQAIENVNAARDEHWLQNNPIDYA